MDNLTDEQLISLYFQGQAAALESLIERYLAPLYNFALKYVHTQAAAQDVTQEAMVKIWRNLKKFDRQRKFKTWAYTILKNTALDYLKKKDLLPFSAMEAEGEKTFLSNLVSREPLPEQLLMQAEDAGQLSVKVNRLAPKYRDILRLYYEHGLNFREISDRLKTSIDTIKTRHRRAVLQIKKDAWQK